MGAVYPEKGGELCVMFTLTVRSESRFCVLWVAASLQIPSLTLDSFCSPE